MRYKIFPPFVDAYRTGDGNLGEIYNVLINHSHDWGEVSVGRSVLENRSAMYDDKIVLGCASLYDDARQFLCITTPGEDWYDKLEIVEAPIGDYWDVT